MKQVFCIIFISLLLFSSNTAYSQLEVMFRNPTSADSNTNTLFFEIDNLNFFRNSECKAEKVSGYTLPGFRLIPRLSYQVDKKLNIEAGISMLHYWGDKDIPRFLPYLSAEYSIKPNLIFIIGNYYANDNHGLIRPFYSREHNMTRDMGSGLQFLYDSRFFSSDLWLNWENYISYNDTLQERFTFGFSAQVKFVDNDRFFFSMPLQMLAHHNGGEISDTDSLPITTITNLAGGLRAEYKFNKKFLKRIGLEFYYAKYIENTGSVQPFDNGFGLYSKLSLYSKKWTFSLSHWDGEDFVSILGSDHFNNYSSKISDFTFYRMQTLFLQIDYLCVHKKNYSFGLEFTLIHYFPFIGDRPAHPNIVRGSSQSFTFGAYLRFNPKFKIRTLLPE